MAEQDRSGFETALANAVSTNTAISPILGEQRTAHRNALLDAIRSSADFTNLASKLKPDEVYRVVLKDGTSGPLAEAGMNVFHPFVRGVDGRIVATAKLVRPSLNPVAIIASLAGYAMMVEVSSKLDRLQGAVDQILIRMQAGSIGRLHAAYADLKALKHFNDHAQPAQVSHAVQVAGEEFASRLETVRATVPKVPEPSTSWISWPFGENGTGTAAKLGEMQAEMKIALLALRVLTEALIIQNGPIQAARILQGRIDDALALPLDEIARKGRLVNVSGHVEGPEKFWLNTKQLLEAAAAVVTRRIDPDRAPPEFIEVTGAELVPR